MLCPFPETVTSQNNHVTVCLQFTVPRPVHLLSDLWDFNYMLYASINLLHSGLVFFYFVLWLWKMRTLLPTLPCPKQTHMHAHKCASHWNPHVHTHTHTYTHMRAHTYTQSHAHKSTHVQRLATINGEWQKSNWACLPLCALPVNKHKTKQGHCLDNFNWLS